MAPGAPVVMEKRYAAAVLRKPADTATLRELHLQRLFQQNHAGQQTS